GAARGAPAAPPSATPREADSPAGAAGAPYGSPPTDLVVARDGSLFVSDWADGQRPRRGRGRVYLIRWKPDKKTKPDKETGRQGDKENEPVARLDSESYFERCEAQSGIERRGKDGLGAVVGALGGRPRRVRRRV